MSLKRLGGRIQSNVTAVKDMVMSRQSVQKGPLTEQMDGTGGATDKTVDTTSGATDRKRINKITLNLNQSVNSKDASVNAKVGLGGKMVNTRVLLDSGADFSCVRNGAVLHLLESGIDLVVNSVQDPSFSGVAANNAPIAIVGLSLIHI